MSEATFFRRFNHAFIGFAFSATLVLSAGAAQADVIEADVIEIDNDGVSHVRTAVGAVEWINDTSEDALGDLGADVDAATVPDAALSPLGGISPPAAFANSLVHAADLAGISPVLLEALVWQESRWHPGAISPKGALGLGQLMPATARQLGVDPRDPDANLIGAARYLRSQLDRFDNNLELALAAYNAGPARVARVGAIPNIAETRTYVAQITARLSSTARLP